MLGNKYIPGPSASRTKWNSPSPRETTQLGFITFDDDYWIWSLCVFSCCEMSSVELYTVFFSGGGVVPVTVVVIVFTTICTQKFRLTVISYGFLLSALKKNDF